VILVAFVNVPSALQMLYGCISYMLWLPNMLCWNMYSHVAHREDKKSAFSCTYHANNSLCPTGTINCTHFVKTGQTLVRPNTSAAIICMLQSLQAHKKLCTEQTEQCHLCKQYLAIIAPRLQHKFYLHVYLCTWSVFAGF